MECRRWRRRFLPCSTKPPRAPSVPGLPLERRMAAMPHSREMTDSRRWPDFLNGLRVEGPISRLPGHGRVFRARLAVGSLRRGEGPSGLHAVEYGHAGSHYRPDARVSTQAAMLCAVEGNSQAPAFLVHDSPREGDLDPWTYARLLEALFELGPDESTAPFQYIVTTTTDPPEGVRSRVRLKISAGEEQQRLFQVDL